MMFKRSAISSFPSFGLRVRLRCFGQDDAGLEKFGNGIRPTDETRHDTAAADAVSRGRTQQNAYLCAERCSAWTKIPAQGDFLLDKFRVRFASNESSEARIKPGAFLPPRSITSIGAANSVPIERDPGREYSL